MCNFGLEITPVSSGTISPESLAQYDRNIQKIVNSYVFFSKQVFCVALRPLINYKLTTLNDSYLAFNYLCGKN